MLYFRLYRRLITAMYGLFVGDLIVSVTFR